MPARTEETVELKVRHEEFCISAEPRIETYNHLADDPASGRSRATHRIERCMDCGAMHYTPLV